MTAPASITRIKVPESAPRGSVVPVKALISHVMETGDRHDASGARVPRHIINRFSCAFNGQLVFSCMLGTGISANPFFEFDLLLTESGSLKFSWFDENGSVYDDAAEIMAI